MKETLGLIVTDSSPLITLAAADSLHVLTMPGLPVMIPDMVYHETTKYIAKLGASVVVDWVRKARPLVTIEPTDVFAEYLTLLDIDPGTKTRDRGERSASEVLGDAIAANDGMSAILLFGDSDVNRRSFINTLPERVMPLSTGGYLRVLEDLGRIQSADVILDQATARGRDVTGQRKATLSTEAKAALRPSMGKTSGGAVR